ncbi:MAG: hypothetical protein LW817_01700 [Candidatus Caenarcaniphilales bacterium]|jgi:nucleoside-diphosphate kinase|nr:hypothetical protein [Candidatus Caenarcaniphilales bacterium]
MTIEKTFLAVKPEAFSRGDAQGIVEMLSKLLPDAKCLAMKIYQPTEALAKEHYAALSDKPFFPELIKSFTAGKIVGMVWEAENVVARARDAMGATDPSKAADDTIRKVYGKHIGDNAIHGSDTEEGSAAREIQIHFPEANFAQIDPIATLEALFTKA